MVAVGIVANFVGYGSTTLESYFPPYSVMVETVADSIGYGSATLGSYSPPYFVMVETAADSVDYGSTTLGSYSPPYSMMAGRWPDVKTTGTGMTRAADRDFRYNFLLGPQDVSSDTNLK
ncbi:chromosome partitioning protein Smc [Sesbania bispinosa]|nr:chromosome partitioning protein Smc [Sesbania bispinosa]